MLRLVYYSDTRRIIVKGDQIISLEGSRWGPTTVINSFVYFGSTIIADNNISTVHLKSMHGCSKTTCSILVLQESFGPDQILMYKDYDPASPNVFI